MDNRDYLHLPAHSFLLCRSPSTSTRSATIRRSDCDCLLPFCTDAVLPCTANTLSCPPALNIIHEADCVIPSISLRSIYWTAGSVSLSCAKKRAGCVQKIQEESYVKWALICGLRGQMTPDAMAPSECRIAHFWSSHLSLLCRNRSRSSHRLCCTYPYHRSVYDGPPVIGAQGQIWVQNFSLAEMPATPP